MLTHTPRWSHAPGSKVVPSRWRSDIYGAGGEWDILFAASDGYLGTELYRCIGTSGRYITVDRFSCAEAWHRLLDQQGHRYVELDRLAGATTSSERELAAVEGL
jgi:hypothetical protein